jgi:hypothetical protein
MRQPASRRAVHARFHVWGHPASTAPARNRPPRDAAFVGQAWETAGVARSWRQAGRDASGGGRAAQRIAGRTIRVQTSDSVSAISNSLPCAVPTWLDAGSEQRHRRQRGEHTRAA